MSDEWFGPLWCRRSDVNSKNAGQRKQSEIKIVTPPVNRVRASGPILILAILFVVASS